MRRIRFVCRRIAPAAWDALLLYRFLLACVYVGSSRLESRVMYGTQANAGAKLQEHRAGAATNNQPNKRSGRVVGVRSCWPVELI